MHRVSAGVWLRLTPPGCSGMIAPTVCSSLRQGGQALCQLQLFLATMHQSWGLGALWGRASGGMQGVCYRKERGMWSEGDGF